MIESRERTLRDLVRRTSGLPASDGAGVELTRIIGSPELDMLDPFLLLDAFGSDRPQDYIAGFPDHPHRGFETVTYLLAGRMRHRDSAGHEGIIEAGGVQWMTAGRGIIHSEMPEQQDGLLKGFQLWVNLPRKAKMVEPAYQEFPVAAIPVETREDGTMVRVIAGRTDAGTVGPVTNHYIEPTYLDISLPPEGMFDQFLGYDDNAFIYVIEGEVAIGEHRQMLAKDILGVLGNGDRVMVHASDKSARFLLVAGQPLNEPVARGGPFVMNTQEEIRQAFADFRNNRF